MVVDVLSLLLLFHLLISMLEPRELHLLLRKGLVGLSRDEEGLCEAFVFSLETAQDDKAGDDPEDAWVAVVD